MAFLSKGQTMRTISLGVLALVLGLSAGCVKMHVDTVIDKDGTGTCTLTYAMSAEVAVAFEKLQASSGTADGTELGASPPSLKEMTRQRVETICQDAGVELVDHKYTDDENGVSLTLKIAFPDVSKLSSALNVLNSSADGTEQEVLRIVATDDGNYLLTSATVPGAQTSDTASAEEEAEEEQEATEADDLAAMEESWEHMNVLMSHLGEMDMRLSFTVPGDVIHSNAMEVEGRTSIWTISAANMMQAEEMDMAPEIRFSGKGLKIKPSAP
jgi:hypothetical protein